MQTRTGEQSIGEGSFTADHMRKNENCKEIPECWIVVERSVEPESKGHAYDRWCIWGHARKHLMPGLRGLEIRVRFVTAHITALLDSTMELR